MYDFDFWYAYFDSLFTKPKIALNPSFISTLNLDQLLKAEFPECKKLPQISDCFKQFDKFLTNQDTWVQSDCQQSFLKEIQKNINLTVLLIQVQKKYGTEFWHSKRRVQASICHFFSLLNFFLNSLISNNVDTIETSKKSNNLCTSLKSLEALVNRILPHMNPIIKFVYQEHFSQEKRLTILFLQQIREVLLNLPTLNRKKFNYQFQLTKYLFLIIPIELSKVQYQFKAKRKKAITLSNRIQVKYHSEQFNLNQNIQKSPLIDAKRRLSMPRLNKIQHKTIVINPKVSKNQKNPFQLGESPRNTNPSDQALPALFEFSQKVRKYSFQVNKKKITKTTLNTRQTMELKAEFEKERKKSDFAKTSNSLSKQKNLGRSFSISKNNRQFVNQGHATTRSKKSSFQNLHRNVQIHESQKHRPHKQFSPLKQRQKLHLAAQLVIKKPFVQTCHWDMPKRKVLINEGKSTRWGVIQEQINKKTVLKKIKELIHINIDEM